MKGKSIVIKIGGRAASNQEALKALIQEMAKLQKEYNFIMVHGGGAEVSKATKVYGLEPTFVDGVRMTTPEEMDIVDMVLAGKMNKYIVRLFQGQGVNAVGLSGSDGCLFTGESLDGDKEGGTRTGKVTYSDTTLLKLLVGEEYLPVISSTSMDKNGNPLNINADEAAFWIARTIPASGLVFISDIPGILKEGEVIRNISEDGVEEEINNGTITGGMIPKVKSSVEALQSGVDCIIIGEYKDLGDLEKLLNGDSGSRIEN